MAMTEQERDQKRREKEARLKMEDLRMKAMPGTCQALAEIMEWAEVEQNGEAMTLMIHRIHELGPEAAKHFLSAPRHEIKVSEIVARKLENFSRQQALRIGTDIEDEDE